MLKSLALCCSAAPASCAAAPRASCSAPRATPTCRGPPGRAARAARSPRPAARSAAAASPSRRTTTPPSPRSPTRSPPTRWCTRSSSAASWRSRVTRRVSPPRESPEAAIDRVVPVPLSARRLRERGYNQAVEIARHRARGAARARRFACATAIRRRRRTCRARAPRNVRGAFRCARAVAGQRVAVVDDVMTTGATLDEIARDARRRAGAARVVNWVVARTPARRLMFDIVLVQPEIPPNTGNVIRLAANTGAGCTWSSRSASRWTTSSSSAPGSTTTRRATSPCTATGAACRARARRHGALFALTTRGTQRSTTTSLPPGDVFVFGAETTGLPASLLDAFPDEQRLRLPMRPGNRSLNLSNAVAVVVFEAWRQLGFRGAREPRPEPAAEPAARRQRVAPACSGMQALRPVRAGASKASSRTAAKLVVIVAPHTSNWDFPVGILGRVRPRPPRALPRQARAVPAAARLADALVRRHPGRSRIAAGRGRRRSVEAIEPAPSVFLAITPAGTRSSAAPVAQRLLPHRPRRAAPCRSCRSRSTASTRPSACSRRSSRRGDYDADLPRLRRLYRGRPRRQALALALRVARRAALRPLAGASLPSSTAFTASVTGMSTPLARQIRATSFAERTPSATWPRSEDVLQRACRARARGRRAGCATDRRSR